MNIKSSLQLTSLAVLLLASATALAQTPASSAMQHQQQQQVTTGQPGDNAMPNDGSTPNFADQAFVQDTLKNNQVQVQASQLAQQKASSGDVKEFSQKMIDIHNQLTTQLTPLARHLQVSSNQKPSKKERQELAQLDQLSGSAFDTAYMQVMAREQQHILKEFKHEESAQNPMLQKVAKADSSVLTQNYQILEKIAQTHNIPLDSKD